VKASCSNFLRSAATQIVALVCVAPLAGIAALASDDETQIWALLSTYQDALNASSTAAVMHLYASDGVFMPPYSPSAVSASAIRQAYDTVLKAITLHVTFTVVE